MTEIIEHPDHNGDEARLVRVGDGERPVSLKTYQDIYHQVTGRTEQIRKRYFDNLLMEFSDLQQLHIKITQLCDVHQVVARNASISIFHDKERKEQFTSFERFQAYNSNAASPTVSIILKYNFSIIPAGLHKPQEYVINARLSSRIAMLEQLDDEAPPFLRGNAYFGYMHENTAEITVDYADYVIARGFLEAFDEWIAGCKKIPQSKVLNFARRNSGWLPLISRTTVATLLTWFAWETSSMFAKTGVPVDQWAKLAIIYFGGGFVLVTLAGTAAMFVEQAIDSYPELSYLKLNKGDANLLDKFASRKRHVVVRFIGGSLMAIILGIVSSKLERLI
jgi:hypothetical protein